MVNNKIIIFELMKQMWIRFGIFQEFFCVGFLLSSVFADNLPIPGAHYLKDGHLAAAQNVLILHSGPYRNGNLNFPCKREGLFLTQSMKSKIRLSEV